MDAPLSNVVLLVHSCSCAFAYLSDRIEGNLLTDDQDDSVDQMLLICLTVARIQTSSDGLCHCQINLFVCLPSMPGCLHSSFQAYIERVVGFRRSRHCLDPCVGFSFIIHETSANLFWEL